MNISIHLEVIAFLAGLISSTAAIPQIITMISTKKTKGVSTFMFCMKNVSNSLWIIFGLYSMTYSIIFWNVISLALCTAVIVMKYKILKEKAKQAATGNIVPMFIAVDNTLDQPAHQHYEVRPALRLVYSKPQAVLS